MQMTAHRSICPNCGMDVEPGAKFCPNCGTGIEDSESASHGSSCPRCGVPVLPGEKFCAQCGCPLTEADTTVVGNSEGALTEQAEVGGSVQTAQRLLCPGCGAPLDASQTMCPRCGHKVYVTTFTSAYDLSMEALGERAKQYNAEALRDPADAAALFSLGCCQLRMGRYAKAQRSFARAIDLDFDNAEAYLYHAVCLMRGEAGAAIDLYTVDRIMDDIRAGIEVNDIPGLYLLWALVTSECYEKAGLSSDYSSAQIMTFAEQRGASPADWDRLNKLIFGE